MDQLRTPVALVVVLLIAVALVFVSTSIFRFDPLANTKSDAVRQQVADLDRINPKRKPRSESTGNDDSLKDRRIRRLQQLLATQRDEITRLRELVPASSVVRTTRKRPTLGSLLPKIPDGLLSDDAEENAEPNKPVADSTDTTSLMERLETADSLIDEHNKEVTQLKNTVDQLREEIVELKVNRDESEESAARSLTQQRDIRNEATQALASLGPDAAAALLPLAVDDRKHVRDWVESLLLKLGGQGSDEP